MAQKKRTGRAANTARAKREASNSVGSGSPTDTKTHRRALAAAQAVQPVLIVEVERHIWFATDGRYYFGDAGDDEEHDNRYPFYDVRDDLPGPRVFWSMPTLQAVRHYLNFLQGNDEPVDTWEPGDETRQDLFERLSGRCLYNDDGTPVAQEVRP